MKICFAKPLILAMTILAGFTATAQEQAATGSASGKGIEIFIYLMMGFVLITFLFVLYYFATQIIERAKENLDPERYEKFKDVHLVPGIDWAALNRQLTDAVPIVEEGDIMLDHDYDGIHELDNHLPPWWKALFYGTIVYAIVYVIMYFGFSQVNLPKLAPQTQLHEYETQMQIAAFEEQERRKLMAETVDEYSVVWLQDASSISQGKSVFELNCATCHGLQGEGGTGPAFVDRYWLHGNSIVDVFKTVKYGVQGKGMQEWDGILSPQEMAQVASYIKNFEGTTPSGVDVKKPQGELYPAEGEESAEDDSIEQDDEESASDTTSTETAGIFN